MHTRSVAIIGASTDRHKFGNKAVRAYGKAGWTVYPVNPHHEQIEEYPAFKSVLDVPEPLTRISLYLPPKEGIKMLEQIAAKPHLEFFVNPGAESEALLEEARKLDLDPVAACSIIDIGESPSEF